MAEITIRFHGELDALLAPGWRGREMAYRSAEHANAKHAIEALGVPHTEVGQVLVDGRPAALDHALRRGEHIDVLPAAGAAHGAAPRFIADAHLARLARWLRFAGCDTLHCNAWDDRELVAIACAQQRIVLTRDRALLMRRDVVSGCWVRDDQPLAQLLQVARRFGLGRGGRARCLLCNLPLEAIDRAAAADRVPSAVAARHERFWSCAGCRRIYWRGSHWQRMHDRLAAATAASTDAAGNGGD